MTSVSAPASAFSPRALLARTIAHRRSLVAPSLALALSALGGCGGPSKVAPTGYAAPSYALAETASGEVYQARVDNQQVSVAEAPISTFSIDVDTASYANVRRLLRAGTLPPPDAVRAEELINAFAYRYELPKPGAEPIAVSTELAASPFHANQHLLRIGLATAPLPADATPPRNLVFLVDTSGSMSSADKLPLLVSGLRLLVNTLRPVDRVSIVAYAGSAGAVLPPTSGDRKAEILEALGRLGAGGSTNGGAGIELAYRLAAESFDKGGINRVILCTDGDFNVGVSSQDALVELISAKRKTGVYLTVMGFGTGNLKDATMESLAQHGNGNYSYVDTLDEAKKLLVDEAGATLVTVANDVKVQVAFDPARVASYRLVGYENRLLSERDFTNDQKDAGELGASHRVTALYELALTAPATTPAASPVASAPAASPLLTVRVRGKRELGERAFELATTVADSSRAFVAASPDLRFAAAVAGFAMNLRGDASAAGRGDADYRWTRDTALAALSGAPNDAAITARNELVELIELAARLAGTPLSPTAQVAAPAATVAR